MVPVRKPGRPLSACPHAPSQACGCGGVTAAIPRKQQCCCGTGNATTTPETNGIKTESPGAGSDAPSSPARNNNTNGGQFRVQKNGAKTNGRKQSFDPSMLDRIDANHINVVPRMAQANGSMAAMPDFAETPPMMPGEMAYNPHLAYGVFPPPLARPLMPPPVNGKLVIDPSAAGPPSVPITAPQTPVQAGSCCAPAATSPTLKASPPAPAAGSCCAPAPTQSPALGPVSIPMGEMGHPDGVPISPFQQVMGLGPTMFPPFYHQPMIYTYPSHYGSYLQPLQPAQWRQTMEAMSYGAFPMPAPGPVGFVAPGAPQNHDATTSHQCDCGDGCQCVGCAAHPYNVATQNYVRSAWNSMHEDAAKAGPAAAATNGDGSEALKAAAADREPTDPPGSPAPQTPSDAASGISEEQALSASDFFFVTYPLNGDPTCLGDAPTCPCGDDCQCIGCAIHSTNGVIEEGVEV